MKEADGLGKNSVDMGYQLQKIGNEWKEYSVLIEQYIRDERVDFDDIYAIVPHCRYIEILIPNMCILRPFT